MNRAGIAQYREVGANHRQLVEQYGTLVKRIAHHMAARLPDSVQIEDLIQAGMVGLLEAASKYDGARGASFSTYAGIRIRGAMLDEIRRGDWIPRSVHRNARRIADTIRRLEHELGREVQDTEIASAMEVDLEEYHTMVADSRSARLFSFDELTERGGEDTHTELAAAPKDELGEGYERHAFVANLADAIRTLPDREQLILNLYYEEELNLKEIGAVIGVSESRISQIMSKATLKLRARVASWLDEPA